MGKRHRFGNILIQSQGASHRAGNLGNLQRMGQAGAKIIPLMIEKDLCFMFQAAKGHRMNNAVTVALKRAAGEMVGLFWRYRALLWQ